MESLKKAGLFLKRSWNGKSAKVIALMVQSLLIALLSLTIIFGPTNLDLADGGGSSADWLAAVGTWVIGIAAASIAYISHRRNEQDAESEEVRRSDVREVQRMHVAVGLADAYGLINLTDKFSSLDAGEQTIANLNVLLERLLRDAKEVVLGDPYISCLTTEIVVEIKAINNNLDFVRDLVELQKSSISRRPAGSGKPMAIAWDFDVLKQIEREAADAQARCKRVFDALDEL